MCPLQQSGVTPIQGHHLGVLLIPYLPCRIYSDGLSKDSKQSFISWLVAITTLTLYTGERQSAPASSRGSSTVSASHPATAAAAALTTLRHLTKEQWNTQHTCVQVG